MMLAAFGLSKEVKPGSVLEELQCYALFYAALETLRGDSTTSHM